MEFDAHVHLDYGGDVDRYAQGLRKFKMRAGVSSCGPVFCQPGNGAVEKALKKHGDVIVGFGYVRLGRGDTAKTVERLHKKGFRALKVIIPKKDYDDKSFYPIYRKAEKLGMPILFHTGVMARTDVMAEHYKDVPGIPKVDHRKLDVSCRRMDPMCLDTIARAFPDLNIILAHYGSTGRRDNAAGVVAWNPNVYADLTTMVWSWTTESFERDVASLRMIPKNAQDRLLFGTDNTMSRQMKFMAKFKKTILDLLKAAGVKKSLHRMIMGETMNRMLGLD